jgi:hypothetical protein
MYWGSPRKRRVREREERIFAKIRAENFAYSMNT